MHTEVSTLIDRLRAIIRACEVLIMHVEDLHVLAWDRPANDDPKVRGGGLPDPVGGDAYARKVFGRLFARTKDIEVMMTGFRVLVLNLLNRGQANPNLYGSRESPAEFARALKAQQRREQRGEYSPMPNVAQPKYPKRGSR